MLILLSSSFSISYAGNYFFPDGDKNPAAALAEKNTTEDTEDDDPDRYKNDDLDTLTDKGKFGSGFEGGNSFDRSGTYSGKVDPFGHAYDKSGNYSGRIDRFGNVYDRAGNYSGKVKPKP
jgi:hypothetical protein